MIEPVLWDRHVMPQTANGVERARPWLERIDHFLKPRLIVLSAGRANHIVITLAAALMALTFVPLAAVPYGVSAPALGVLALGLGLMAGDGLMVLIDYSFAVVTVYLLATAV